MNVCIHLGRLLEAAIDLLLATVLTMEVAERVKKARAETAHAQKP